MAFSLNDSKIYKIFEKHFWLDGLIWFKLFSLEPFWWPTRKGFLENGSISFSRPAGLNRPLWKPLISSLGNWLSRKALLVFMNLHGKKLHFLIEFKSQKSRFKVLHFMSGDSGQLMLIARRGEQISFGHLLGIKAFDCPLNAKWIE